MKQMNFYLRWQEATRAGRAAQRRTLLAWVLPGVGAVLAAEVFLAAMAFGTGQMQAEAQRAQDWCSANSLAAESAAADRQAAAQRRAGALLARQAGELLQSYPEMTGALLEQLEAVGGDVVQVRVRSYDAGTGKLVFDAQSGSVIDIPAYVRALEGTGLFSAVVYTGYGWNGALYSIDLDCTLAAPRQEVDAP